MKAEHVPLTVALIAAAASLSAVLYNQYSVSNLEERKWQQAQQDSLRAIVVDFAKEITAAHQRAEWFVWSAKHASDAISQKDFDAFDGEAKASLPRIFGFRVLLTAKRPAAYAALEQVVNGYYSADECIGLAGAAFRRGKADGIRSLSVCHSKVASVSTAMVPAFTAAMRATNLPEPAPK